MHGNKGNISWKLGGCVGRLRKTADLKNVCDQQKYMKGKKAERQRRGERKYPLCCREVTPFRCLN